MTACEPIAVALPVRRADRADIIIIADPDATLRIYALEAAVELARQHLVNEMGSRTTAEVLDDARAVYEWLIESPSHGGE